MMQDENYLFDALAFAAKAGQPGLSCDSAEAALDALKTWLVVEAARLHGEAGFSDVMGLSTKDPVFKAAAAFAYSSALTQLLHYAPRATG